MCTPASVRIDDYFSTSQASVALWATDDELTRWVDVQMSVIAEES